MRLKATSLTIETSVTPKDQAPVPVSFGWHPYLQLPKSKRDDWTVTSPPLKQVALDQNNLPAHPLVEKTAADFAHGQPLKGHQFDDLFSGMHDGSTAHINGPASSIAVTFDQHYQWMQIFSPADATYCCIEPMTSLTAQLSDDASKLPQAPPEMTWSAQFTVSIKTTDA